MEVIILAGGLGTRLSPLVPEVPKCLAPVSGRPFLSWLLDWLQQYPVTHIVFSVGHLREQVIRFVESEPRNFAYHFAEEESPLGTGGGIRLALSYCLEDEVFVINGDTFFPVDLTAIPTAAPVTVALKRMKRFSRYGAVQLEGNGITAFHEKTYCEEGLVNGGVYALDRRLLDLQSFPEKFSFEKDFLEPEAANNHVNGCISGAYFIDIGIPEDYSRAQREIPEWFAVKEASRKVMASSARYLFLDRDGVINRLLPGDYVKRWEEFHFLPGVLEALALWAEKFRRIILVTNQRGVGKGLMTDEDLSRIHARMMQEILEAGGRIDLILTCTALDENDPRRKPRTGMFEEAATLFPDITPEQSIMIGDAPSDAAFAQNCGMQFVKI